MITQRETNIPGHNEWTNRFYADSAKKGFWGWLNCGGKRKIQKVTVMNSRHWKMSFSIVKSSILMNIERGKRVAERQMIMCDGDGKDFKWKSNSDATRDEVKVTAEYKAMHNDRFSLHSFEKRVLCHHYASASQFCWQPCSDVTRLRRRDSEKRLIIWFVGGKRREWDKIAWKIAMKGVGLEHLGGDISRERSL